MARIGACENRRGEGSSRLPDREISRPRPDMQTRLLGGFCDSRSRYRGPRGTRDRTRRIARAWRACPIIAASSTRPAVSLAQTDRFCLDDPLGGAVSFESEQSKNRAGRIMPLYAARAAHGGNPIEGLLRGSGIKPTGGVLGWRGRLAVAKPLPFATGSGMAHRGTLDPFSPSGGKGKIGGGLEKGTHAMYLML